MKPAQRARHVTRLTFRNQARDPAHLARLADLAAHLEALDAAETLAVLERVPRETPEIRRTKLVCEAALAAQRYLRGDPEGSLSDLAAIIAAHPEEAMEAHYFRSIFLELRGEIDAAIADMTRMITLAPLDANAYARRGEIYHRAGHHDEALANFRRAAQLDPDNLAALSGAGVCLMLTHDWEGAIPWLTRAARIHPKAPSLWVERALCFENLKRYDEAVADLDVAITLAPDDDESLHARGRCRPESQRTEEIADYTRALELAPGRADIWMARGRAHFKNAALDEALADTTRAVELDPTDARAHLFLSFVHSAAGHPARAKESYDEALRLAPAEVRQLSAHARANEALRDPPALRRDLDALVARAPALPELRRLRSRLLMHEGAFARALEDFDAALALLERAPLPDAEMAKLHHERAAALRGLERDEESAAAEGRAIEHAPEVALYWSWRGMARARVEALAHLAEADLTRAIALAPSNPAMRFNRAMYYEHVERWSDALADLEQAIALASESVAMLHVHRGLTRWLASDDPVEHRKAMADYDRALELDGTDAEALRWRARGHAHFGDHQAALADLDRAVAIDPESGEAYHLRFESRSALGDVKGAREDLERAATLDDPDAVEELRLQGETRG